MKQFNNDTSRLMWNASRRTEKESSRWSALLFALLLSSAIALSGCKTLDAKTAKISAKNKIEPSTLQGSKLGDSIVREPRAIQTESQLGQPGRNAQNTVQLPSQIGRIPVISERNGDTGTSNSRAPRPKAKTIDAFVSPLTVPQFIDVVFGEMLEVPYVTGPAVAEMTDVVQLRSSGEMKATDFQALVSEALEAYGVRVVPENGALQILQDRALRSRIPKFIKSRARLRTRNDLRPVIQFVEMQAVDANSMIGFLRQAFANKADKLTITANVGQNFISLAGLPGDVDAAIAIIRELDELDFAGSQIQRYTPKYWNTDDFAKALENALLVEGWLVTTNVNLNRTIFLMPVEYSNDLFIFAKTKLAHERVDTWIRELDRPVQGGDTKQIFIYQVKNVDATILVETANSVLSSSGNPGANKFAPSIGAGLSGTQNQQNQDDGTLLSGNTAGVFTVDAMGNRIIFTGTSSDYDKLYDLLEQLDTPAPEVLIEVQIAEVTLTDGSNFGIEFFIDQTGANYTATAGTDGLGLGTSGLNVGLLSGNVDAVLNAFASNRQVKLLSTPILVARSGGEAEIQVGQDIPIITAQRAANNQNGTGATDILQSIDYRKIGNLLSISPIVFSDNRIDLDITQEVSSTVDVSNSTISSPTISNRSLSTQLSLEDGQTAVLGGLISESYIRDEKGVPFLKDIPIIGQAFSNDGLSINRTELVVLITAYVLRGQNDKAQFVNRLRNSVDTLLADEDRFVTLLPKTF